MSIRQAMMRTDRMILAYVKSEGGWAVLPQEGMQYADARPYFPTAEEAVGARTGQRIASSEEERDVTRKVELAAAECPHTNFTWVCEWFPDFALRVGNTGWLRPFGA